jgi:hypothetical protein
MGRSYSLGHKVGFISKNSFREDLIRLIDFDEDLNGNNGKEYTRDEAIEKGYNSTVEFLVDEGIEKFGENQNAIDHLIDGALEQDDYYHSYQHTVIHNNKDNIYYVFISFMSGS